jgi:hypothetical protein
LANNLARLAYMCLRSPYAGGENLRSFLSFVLLYALTTTAQGQDRHEWQSLAGLHAGDRVRASLKTGLVDGEFQSWTPQEAMIGVVTARREDVLKIERYRHGGSRGKHIAIGALIGFGGCGGGLGPCVTRPVGGTVAEGAGAVIGALVVAIHPAKSKELIYSAR